MRFVGGHWTSLYSILSCNGWPVIGLAEGWMSRRPRLIGRTSRRWRDLRKRSLFFETKWKFQFETNWKFQFETNWNQVEGMGRNHWNLKTSPWCFAAWTRLRKREPSDFPRCHKERTCPWKELSKCLPSASLLLLQSFSPRRRRRRRRRGRRCPSPRWRTSLPGRTLQTGASKTGWARSEGSLINTPSASTPPTPPTALIELWIPLNRSRVDKSWNLSWLDS